MTASKSEMKQKLSCLFSALYSKYEEKQNKGKKTFFFSKGHYSMLKMTIQCFKVLENYSGESIYHSRIVEFYMLLLTNAL